MTRTSGTQDSPRDTNHLQQRLEMDLSALPAHLRFNIMSLVEMEAGTPPAAATPTIPAGGASRTNGSSDEHRNNAPPPPPTVLDDIDESRLSLFSLEVHS